MPESLRADLVTMTPPYLGLRGSSLTRTIIGLVVCPAFVTYGYNLSVAGGLLTLESFVETFPQLDTLNTSGSQQHYNSTIQGALPCLIGSEKSNDAD